MSLNFPGADYEFRAVAYEPDAPTTPPEGIGWVCVAFCATQSTNADGTVDRTAWILWVRHARASAL